MYKKIFALVLIFGLCFTVVAAQETQGKKESTGLSDWLRGIQKKIEQIIPKKSLPVTTGVAGVRGAINKIEVDAPEKAPAVAA